MTASSWFPVLLAGAAFAVGVPILAIALHRAVLLRRYLEREHRELARERELGHRRDEMLSGVAHDLKTPLTMLVMASHQLTRQLAGTDESATALARQIERSATRTDQLLTELLDFARVESGRLSLNSEPITVANLIAEATEEVSADHARVGIVADVPVDALINGDRPRLRAALRNLLENAVRYADPPIRVLVVDLSDAMEFHVQDAGPGIPESERDIVFERFERGSTSVGHAGTGIGLYLSRQLVALQGGSLTLTQSPLGGSDFVITLPKSIAIRGA